MKYLEDLVKYLPLGYVYLVIMGILKESLFYNQLGINILNFSSLTDILISPIAAIASEFLLLISILILTLIFVIIVRFRHKKWARNFFAFREGKKNGNLNKEIGMDKMIFSFAVMMLGFFLKNS